MLWNYSCLSNVDKINRIRNKKLKSDVHPSIQEWQGLRKDLKCNILTMRDLELLNIFDNYRKIDFLLKTQAFCAKLSLLFTIWKV